MKLAIFNWLRLPPRELNLLFKLSFDDTVEIVVFSMANVGDDGMFS